MGHFALYVRLSQAMWRRTVFAVVIGNAGVIIEDLEEQQSYFGVIDLLTATGNVRQVRQESQPRKCFFAENNRAPPAVTIAHSLKLCSLLILLDFAFIAYWLCFVAS